MQRRADGGGTVVQDADLDRRRQCLLQAWQFATDAVDRFHDVGIRLPRDDEVEAGTTVLHGINEPVFGAGFHAGNVTHAHRGAITPGDGQAGVVVGVEQLVVGGDGGRGGVAVERSLGAVQTGRLHGGADVIHDETAGGQCLRIHLDADGGFHLPRNAHFCHAGQLADLAGEDILGPVAECGKRQHLRLHRHHHDGAVGGIHLAPGGQTGHVVRQASGGRIEGGLHFLGGGVDRFVEVELERDAGAAQCAGRRHFLDAGDAAELGFQRRGHGRGHGFGVGTGQVGAHAEGRELDLRQRGHRQLRKGQQAEQDDGSGEQRGGNRAPDEQRGKIALSGAHRPCSPW